MKINPKAVIVLLVILAIIAGLVYWFLNRAPQPQEPTVERNMGQGEIVCYYTSWCGYSQQFMPEWRKFEDECKVKFPLLRVRMIQCESGNEALCQQKGIEGYPTVIFYKENGEEIPFTDVRSKDALIQFCANNVE